MTNMKPSNYNYTYYTSEPAMPPQTELITSRSQVTNAYTVIPREVLRHIVTSTFPGWRQTQAWVLARPIHGFATTFAQCLMYVAPGGGSSNPEAEPDVECIMFVLQGELSLQINNRQETLGEGGYAFIPAGVHYSVENEGEAELRFQWIRKAYEPLSGFKPKVLVGNEQDVETTSLNGYQTWSTNLIPTDDLAYDMNVKIVSFTPGAVIPFAETHVMEHGLSVLQGKGVYRLNQDWVEVQEGDFLWLRAFCPQACYAGGPTLFRYLLYKNVNRQINLTDRLHSYNP